MKSILILFSLFIGSGVLATTPVSVARADEPAFVIPEIIKTGTPIDALTDDQILPQERHAIDVKSGSGSVHKALENELPFAVKDYGGRPGSLSQFTGLGRSAEDTNVQTLGIPLN